jgi:hypothetical protein
LPAAEVSLPVMVRSCAMRRVETSIISIRHKDTSPGRQLCTSVFLMDF